MLGDAEVESFKLKISTSEMHLLCCCRVGHGQEYFEARYGRELGNSILKKRSCSSKIN